LRLQKNDWHTIRGARFIGRFGKGIRPPDGPLIWRRISVADALDLKKMRLLRRWPFDFPVF
jgi:hypothetical protein